MARQNPQILGATRYINIGAGGPFAPLPPSGASVATPAATYDGAVASALVSSASPSQTRPTFPAWVVNRLSHDDLNSGPVANYFQHLTHDATPNAKAILTKADQVADAVNLDDELLDSRAAGLSP